MSARAGRSWPPPAGVPATSSISRPGRQTVSVTRLLQPAPAVATFAGAPLGMKKTSTLAKMMVPARKKKPV